MKPVSPHHLLSAYLDGELTPGEREEVERLLTESAEARQELNELEHVGELLRQIPREALPRAFASQVLDVCLFETGEFDSETLTNLPTPGNGKPSRHAVSPTSRRGWFRAAGLTAVLTVLALIVITMIPGSPVTDESEVAQTPPEDNAQTDQAAQEERFSGQRDQPMADDGKGSGEGFNEAGLSKDADSAKTQGTKESQLSSRDRRAVTDAVRESVQAVGRELKTVPPDEIARAMDQQVHQVAVVKVTVKDRRQGLKDLRSLLKRHKIPAADSPNKQRAQTEPKHVAVYVETDNDHFTAAMNDLQNERAFGKLTMESPIGLAQLGPMLSPGERGGKPMLRKRAMSFGAGGGFSPKSSKNAQGQAPEDEAAPPPPSNPARPAQMEKASNKPAEKKAEKGKRESPPPPAEKAESTPKAEPDAKADSASGDSKPKKSPKPRITTAGSKSLNKLRRQVEQKDRQESNKKPGTGKPDGLQSENESPGPPSRRQEFELPGPVLDRLQKPEAEAPSATSKDAEGKKNARPAPARKRVQVVFVLVEDEPSQPARADKPAANDDAR